MAGTITVVQGGGGDDTLIATGGGGAGSPLVLFGDTSQDGVFYDYDDTTGVPTGHGRRFFGFGNDTIDARANQSSVTIYGGGGDDTIWGSQAGDHIAGGSGNDTINGQGGVDHIYGDNGFNLDLSKRLTVAIALASQILLVTSAAGGVAPITRDLLVPGNDTIRGDSGNDIVFGDFGRIDQAAGTQRITNVGFVVGVVSVRIDDGGADTMFGDAGEDLLIGGDGGDRIDGNDGADLIFGDSVTLTRRLTDISNPRFRTLIGTHIYSRTDLDGANPAISFDNSGQLLITGVAQAYRSLDGVPEWALYVVSDLHHSVADQTANTSYGNDYIAGGAGDDVIFGQLGNDTIQGDGSILSALAGLLVGVGSPSFEAASDGDDYIEGGGGADTIFGNLGQDDIVGGSSSLFTLGASSSLRPDGADVIFGGAGTRVARNAFVELGFVEAHSRDADVIVGDNGDIVRLVGLNGVDSGTPLRFNYDNYAGRGIVVRGVTLLDCGTGADTVRGESGDDTIYGGCGDDALYGDSEDDDIVGGLGNDWISGGTGQDGVLGDDGRIFTSRNPADCRSTNDPACGTEAYTQFGEPLYGVAVVAENDRNRFISSPTGDQQAVIYRSHQLLKTADITPFNPVDNGQFDDIIYGGLGSDFLHGGTGDDLVSGAEALVESYVQVLNSAGAVVSIARSDFTHPFNPGNALRFTPGPANTLLGLNTYLNPQQNGGSFALYDVNQPRRVVLLTSSGGVATGTTGFNFITNFSAFEGPLVSGVENGGTPLEHDYGVANSDGDDVVFGDYGNDWLVGGTGRDTLYGGWGNDLLNAHDRQDTGNSRVDQYHPDYADLAFGGAGSDVLMANTYADRLVDWTGSFNQYVAPLLALPATMMQYFVPGIDTFLYTLALAQGVDPTRGAEVPPCGQCVYPLFPVLGSSNGEPHGELGLVDPADFNVNIGGTPTVFANLWESEAGGFLRLPQVGSDPTLLRDLLSGLGFGTPDLAGFAYSPSSLAGDLVQTVLGYNQLTNLLAGLVVLVGRTVAGLVIVLNEIGRLVGLDLIVPNPLPLVIPTLTPLVPLPPTPDLAPIFTTLSVSTLSLPSGVSGSSYSSALAASGGSAPYTWTLTGGALPAGLSLRPDGLLVGTLAGAAGTYTFTVTVTDSQLLAQSASRTLSITVIPALVVATSSLPVGAIGSGYSSGLAASGGTGAYSWTLIGGALPVGLSLSSAGVISGTPGGPAGTYTFTVLVTDSGNPSQSVSQTLSITIYSLVQVATVSLPYGAVGLAYSASLLGSGGTGSYTWALVDGQLPPGLSLSPSGVISGTPTGPAGTYTFTVRVTDTGTGEQAVRTLTITILPQVMIVTVAVPPAAYATPYSSVLAASGGVAPYTWAVTGGALPAGLSLSSGGVLSGTVTGAVGTYTFTVSATDSGTPAQTATRTLSIAVVPGATTLTVAPVLLVTTGGLIKVTVGTVSARLLGPGGVPIAGQTIAFTAGSTTVCSGVTDASGNVSCTMTVLNTTAVIANLGVTAHYTGSTTWAPSTGSAGLA